ncbi:hypothetical protein BSZ36_04240 [Rubricoccus marinus]|uniref:Peptidase M1 membrane alanine aminopeptidase domain-containing protein n=2 Tax=Rubricoccus marinus TaxID=716817 RepID=A0A259U3P8_9BACT|nr:hypothetical protein BSZ36_04240 [Rubricoccus marinus]
METMEEAIAEAAPPIEPVKDLFEPFQLPTPNVYRSASGRPGPQYWQQEADYKIAVSLDPSTHIVSGEVVLSYTNNSPEDLDKMWFQLEQNLFVPTSRGASAGSRADGASLDERNGYRLGTITVDGRTVTPFVDDTRMRLDLPEPLEASGGETEVRIPFSFRVPEGPGTPRMGRLDVADGTIYSMAQWYPRVTVFDDVNGWNNLPYLGSGEFYLEYGDFDLALTVPANMEVVSTGALQNPNDVYSREQRQRLERARTSSERVYIATEDEIGQPGARSGMTTWRFRAENVRDVAWGASAAFIVDAANAPVQMADGSTNNVLIMSAYPKEGLGTPEEPGWEEATHFGKASIENNSYWYPYPYPVAISVASHIGGMEYPMIHFSSVRSRHFSLFGVVDHELGHNWFPMIVGSDERRHAWMDEGFNTFINGPSAIQYYNENPDTSIAGYGQAERTQGVQLLQPDTFARLTGSFGSGDDEILTYADQLSGQEGGWNSYFKPGMGLSLLRTAVLGEERFDRAFKAYIERWAYKHPQPADFFRTMEDVSGEDLDWFWRGWFDTVRTYDAEIDDVDVQDGIARVTVSHVSGLVFPTTVEVTFADGSTARLAVPVEGFGVSEEVTVEIPTDGREVTMAQIDPDGLYPDVDRENDVYVLEEME